MAEAVDLGTVAATTTTGSWTPTIHFLLTDTSTKTYALQEGRFIKVGKQYRAGWALTFDVSTLAGTEGSLLIEGLPGTPDANIIYEPVVIALYGGFVLPNSGTQLGGTGQITPSNSIGFGASGSGATTGGIITAAALVANSGGTGGKFSLTGSITYQSTT